MLNYIHKLITEFYIKFYNYINQLKCEHDYDYYTLLDMHCPKCGNVTDRDDFKD
jgi:hypothetical protein